MLAHLKCACAALEIDSLALEASYAPNSGCMVRNLDFFLNIFDVLRVNVKSLHLCSRNVVV